MGLTNTVLVYLNSRFQHILLQIKLFFRHEQSGASAAMQLSYLHGCSKLLHLLHVAVLNARVWELHLSMLRNTVSTTLASQLQEHLERTWHLHSNLPPIVCFSVLNQTESLHFHLWENLFHRIELCRKFV